MTMLLYVLPMLLGRTYDIATDQVGVDIFPQKYLDGAKVINKHETDSRYIIVEKSSDVRDFLDISGNFALKVKLKSVQLDVSGGGSYLSDSARKRNSVEILVRVHYETETRTLHSSAKPYPDWRSYQKLGSHFCRSITYGGDLIASVVFATENEKEIEHIKAEVKGRLKVAGTFDAKMQFELEKLQRNLKGTASMQINYYATVPVHGIPRTLEGLMKLASNFSEHAKNVNEGLGVPLKMELYPLSFIDSAFPYNSQNSIFNSYMDQLEDQLDDLLATKQAIVDWMEGLPPLLPTKLLRKASDFKKSIYDLLSVFRRTIENLDISVNTGKVEQFSTAFAVYRGTSTALPDKYLRQFERLRESLEEEFQEIKVTSGGATYIQWGQPNCTQIGVETVYSGKAMITASSALCIPTYTKFVDTKKILDGPNLIAKNIKCSLCNVRNGNTIFVQPGLDSCPSGWDKKYNGILVSAGKYICLNGGPELASLANVSAVDTSCGILPCDVYKKDTSLACAVCSK